MKIASFPLATIFAALIVCLGANATLAAGAPDTCHHHAAPAGAAAKRVAIVIGNGAYGGGLPALPNPPNDAEATAKALGALGFDIFLATNVDGAALQACLDQAYAGLTDADVALLYYSGHGIQIKDENYLVATDARSGDLAHGFVPVQPIVDALQKRAKATLVLLDACRNNPMAEGGHAGLSVSTGRGLARVKAPAGSDKPSGAGPAAVQARGLMIAYSTSPNAVARDGTGRLSPFTAAFTKLVGTSGYSIQHVMSDVTKTVGEETDWAQTPWMKSSLTEELKLSGGETLAAAQSISDNHAARAQNLLDTDGKKGPAIVEALKGLPAAADEATLKRFPKAYLALYTAVQSREIVLPLSPGMTQVAVSTKDRAAVYRLSADYQSGTFDLWSVSDQTVVAKPEVGRGSEKFTFSPHGKLLGVVSGNATSVFDGVDGSKLFDIRGRASSLEFSPDERRLLLEDMSSNGLRLIDLETRKPMAEVKQSQLDPDPKTRRSTYLAKTTFGSNDTICFILHQTDGNKGVLGVFNLALNKTTRRREVDEAGNTMMCDPAGKYMVRTIGTNGGLEIWDLAADKVSVVTAPIVNIMGIDPKGNYVSVLSSDNQAQGFYDLASGKKGYPPTVPEGFWILGSRVRNTSGGLVSQDVHPNAWRDWPDETLFGPALVKHALAGLTPAQRAEVDRERITYAVTAATSP